LLGWAAKLLLARWISRYYAPRLTANGCGLGEFALPGAAHPTTGPGALAGISPGGQAGYGTIFLHITANQ